MEMRTASAIAPHEAVSGEWTVIDVRSASEYAAEHAPSSMHLPLERVEAGLPLLRQTKQIALLCKSGTRAAMAQERLACCGVEASVVTGGLDAWKRAGLPTVCQMPTRWSLERQVRLIAGGLVLCGTLAAAFWGKEWMWLTGAVGAGLTFAGATDICMMGRLLARMPWNRVRSAP